MSQITPLSYDYSITTYSTVLAEDDGVTRILAIFYTALLAISIVYQLVKWSMEAPPDPKNFAASEILSTRAIHHSQALIARFSTKKDETYRSKLAGMWQSSITTLLHSLHAKRGAINPWEDPAVVRAANQAIQIAYALGHDILSDLTPFSLKASAKYQASFHLEHLFYLPVTYHMARWFATTKEVIDGEADSDDEGVSIPRLRGGFYNEEAEIPKHHITRFYQPGIYNEWRVLFNRYGQEVKSRISGRALKEIDNRLFNWLQEDLDRNTFAYSHDTIPGCNIMYLSNTPASESL